MSFPRGLTAYATGSEMIPRVSRNAGKTAANWYEHMVLRGTAWTGHRSYGWMKPVCSLPSSELCRRKVCASCIQHAGAHPCPGSQAGRNAKVGVRAQTPGVSPWF